jgi:hypothetical protein
LQAVCRFFAGFSQVDRLFAVSLAGLLTGILCWQAHCRLIDRLFAGGTLAERRLVDMLFAGLLMGSLQAGRQAGRQVGRFRRQNVGETQAR